MTIWFSSDLHFSHQNIIKFEPKSRGWFDNVDEMNEHIIDTWNTHVQPEDTVYVLGDVALGPIQESMQNVASLNGTKHLISGNHCRTWKGNKKLRERDFSLYFESGFSTIQDEMYLRLGDTPVVLSHFPYAGDSGDEDRYVEHRPRDFGLWNICGHVHSAWMQNERSINVGWDIWRRPVHESEIYHIIKNGPTVRRSLSELLPFRESY